MTFNKTLSPSEVVRFANSEIRVRVMGDVKDNVCAVIQPTSNPTDTHLVELMFFADALRREGANKIIGVIPYFGYARQNIQHRPGEAVSAHVVVKTLEGVGFDEIVSIDLHDEATAGIFSIPFHHLSALPLLAQKISAIITTGEPVIIVSPDQGGVERARQFSSHFFSTTAEVAIVEKKRNLDSLHVSKALDLYGDVDGKTVILVDDIVTSGQTLINAASLCLDRGARRIIAAITHHDFAPGSASKIQDSAVEKLFTTDTIPLQEDSQIDKLEIVSVASLIAETLKKL